MLTPTPVRANNAIDEISFGVSFTTRIPDLNIIKSLIDIEEKWEKTLPNYELIEGFGLILKSDPDPKPFSVIYPGIMRYQLSETAPDRRKWILRADSSQIVVACSEYSSWHADSEQFMDLIRFALSKIESQCTPIASIDFRCVDAFKGDESLANKIFNLKSEYLPKRFCEAGGEDWRFDQDWISKEITNLKFSHNLRVQKVSSMNNDNTENAISIVHNTSVVDEKNSENFDSDKLFMNNNNEIFIKKIFNEIHNQNKSIISNILDKKILSQIGIID